MSDKPITTSATTEKTTPIYQYENNPEEIRISDLILKIRRYFIFLLSKWWVIGIVMIGAGAFGYYMAKKKPEDFVSSSTFILDNFVNTGDLATSLKNIAGAFGLNSAEAQEGLTLELLQGTIRSRFNVKTVLLDTIEVGGIEDRVAHHYMRNYAGWAEEAGFMDADGNFLYTFQLDSLRDADEDQNKKLETLYKKLVDKHMTVEYVEESGMNHLTVRSNNREFGIKLSNILLKRASDYFVNMAISKEKASLELAENQSDSLYSLLLGKENRLARLQDTDGGKFFAEGFLEEAKLIREIGGMEDMIKEATIAVEVARYDLENKRPVIQFIDRAEFSTYKEEVKTNVFAIIFAVIAGFIIIFILILRKLISDILEEEEEEKEQLKKDLDEAGY